MNGVTFGNLHSYDDLELILNSKTIGMPAPKTEQVEVPGADGALDYTEYFGDIKYQNRPLEFEFSTIIESSSFMALYSRLHNLMNGRRMRITLDDDADFYYEGRIRINEWKSNGRIGKIVIDVDADPYKLKNTETVVTQIITGATAINCRNLRKQVIPTITVSAETTVAYGTYSRTFTGSVTDENIIFDSDQNVLTFTPASGNVTVTIQYQEGEL